jgi:hypothetical protein
MQSDGIGNMRVRKAIVRSSVYREAACTVSRSFAFLAVTSVNVRSSCFVTVEIQMTRLARLVRRYGSLRYQHDLVYARLSKTIDSL